MHQVPVAWIDVGTDSERQIIHEGFENPSEATIIANTICAIRTNSGSPYEEIGVCTAYRRQARLISEDLLARLGSEAVSVKVDVAESFQGAERGGQGVKAVPALSRACLLTFQP